MNKLKPPYLVRCLRASAAVKLKVGEIYTVTAETINNEVLIPEATDKYGCTYMADRFEVLP